MQKIKLKLKSKFKKWQQIPFKKKQGISLEGKINVIKDIEKEVDYDVILQKYKLKNKSK